jgi:hypothetical protein
MRPAVSDGRLCPIPGIRPRTACIAAAVGLGWTVAGGCTPANPTLRTIADSEQIPLGSADQAGAWPFWPTSVRFLALSRSISSAAAGGKSLELFIECLDVDGHSTKALGYLVVELNCPSAVPTSRRMSIDLTDAVGNRSRWDEVTDSYRIDIPAPFDTPPEPGVEFDCRVILFATDGSTPTATTRLTW